MSRVGILNFPGHMNQGANLTSYALQKVLQNWGYDAVNMHLHTNYRNHKEPKYTDFADANIKLTERSAAGPLSMQIYNHQFDTFIVGSDQVWRNADEEMFAWKTVVEPCFHLAFAAPGKRRIAVAASFGRSDYTENPSQRESFAQELRRFAAISVREKSGRRILKELGNFEAEVLIDPVFYLDSRVWHSFAAAKAERKRPMLAYNSFFHQPEMVEIQTALADEYEFVDVCTGRTAQWLADIRDACFVVTDSFHVCCFCLIFGTPFACLSNAGFGQARFLELAETFGFSTERIIDPANVDCLAAEIRRVTALPYDDVAVQSAICHGRSKAHAWLRAALQSPVPEWSGPEFVRATRAEISAEQRADNRWLKLHYSRRNLAICNLLLRISPFFRSKLKAKKEKHERLLQEYPW